MQVTETLNEGLKHEFKIVVPAADLDAKVDARLVGMKDQVKINGFRPGKVPVAHLKKVYGKSVLAETIEQTVRDTNSQIFTERGFKLATEPKVTLPNEEKDVEQLLAGKSDLSYTVAIEVVPEIALADFKTFKIEKPVADVTDAEVDDAVKKIAEANPNYEEKPAGEKAANGDRVTVSFKGSIEGKLFDGGTAQDIPVVIGSNTFIPGFEDQLLGIAAGETKTLTVTFPENYTNEKLAGKPAEFETTATKVEMPKVAEVNEEFAKNAGMESLEKLKEAVKGRLAAEFEQQTRQKVKRSLLDQLDAAHKFGPPPSLVEDEFKLMWDSIVAEMKSANRSFTDDDTTEDKAREEYQKIADRRVRLGLVLSEIGEKNKITVTDEELGKALVERTRQFPGQEKQIWDYYRNNPQAMAQIRAPLFEDKVVDFILELADVSEKKMSREELFKDDDEAKA
jgi:trigger factor